MCIPDRLTHAIHKLTYHVPTIPPQKKTRQQFWPLFFISEFMTGYFLAFNFQVRPSACLLAHSVLVALLLGGPSVRPPDCAQCADCLRSGGLCASVYRHQDHKIDAARR